MSIVLILIQYQGPYSRGIDKPVIAIGVVAAILLGLGLIPPYFEIWKRRGRVVGISMYKTELRLHWILAYDMSDFLFLLTDFLGAVFSLLSIGT